MIFSFFTYLCSEHFSSPDTTQPIIHIKMKKLNTFIYGALVAAMMAPAAAVADVTVPIYNHVAFYNGWALDNIPEEAAETSDGGNMLYTFLVTKKLTEEQLNQIGEKLDMKVTLHAMCDNYDRIASVNLALIPKGQESYKVDFDNNREYQRFEIARWITPFLNRTKAPQDSEYFYPIDNVSLILRDKALRQQYDFWMEVSIFGNPEVGQQQVPGCADCNITHECSVELITSDTPAPLIDYNRLVFGEIRTGEYRADRGINNYNESCTDELGKTIKTWEFEVPEDVADAKILFIISNHGANSGGEEYNRREHFIYFDDPTMENDAMMQYTPGGFSCEPYRERNTMGNGIYGRFPRPESSWAKTSNWCPGAEIPGRVLELGAVKAGKHQFTVSVPDAVFKGQDGYFPVSFYFQGVTEGKVPEAGIDAIQEQPKSAIRVAGGQLSVSAEEPVALIWLYSADGKGVRYSTTDTMPLEGLASGMYIVAVSFENGATEAHSISF